MGRGQFNCVKIALTSFGTYRFLFFHPSFFPGPFIYFILFLFSAMEYLEFVHVLYCTQ